MENVKCSNKPTPPSTGSSVESSNKRIICGVLVDYTELHNQADYWKAKYEEACNENKRLLHMVESILKESQL